MKRIIYASFALLALLAGANSCSMDEPAAGFEGKIEFVIPDFEPDAAATKVTTTVSGTSITSTWDEGDKIGVFPDLGGDQVPFTVTTGAGTNTCAFDGHGWALLSSAKYSAYFPFSADNYGDANAYKSVAVSYLGQSQTEADTFSVGDFDFLACTKASAAFDNPSKPSGVCTFSFKHLGCLIVMDVTFPSAANLSSLELVCNNNLFPQAGVMDLSQDIPAVTPTAMGKTLALDLGGMAVAANQTVRFYMMSAPADLTSENPTVKVTTTTGKELTKQLSSSKNMEAGKSWSIAVAFEGATLAVSPSSFNIDYKAQDITFTVTSSEECTLTPSANWLTFVSSSDLGGNATEYTYRTTVNNVSNSRSCTIAVAGETKNTSVSVSQSGLTLSMPTFGAGHTIYTTTGNYKYRYGPSIIMNSDGTIDAWFSSPGDLTTTPNRGMADVFTWRRSSDAGQTWSTEQIVLTGSAKPAEDWWSVCDPGAACFDGYYYIAYTSTTNTSSDGGLQGLENNCYIARGTSPSGPWEKWNGNGWGGSPKPIIKYMDGSTHNDGPAGKWGIGEPSIVVKGNTIYLYYTYDVGSTPLTKVATADRTNPNWPGSLTFHGTAIDKEWLAATHDGLTPDQGLYKMYDSCDVKYVEDYDLFYAFHSSWRITASSRFSVWTSTDGLTFTYLGSVQCADAPIYWGLDTHDSNLIPYIHNVGVSGDGLGHVNLSKTQYASFGYSPVDATDRAHGSWSTYWIELNY